MDVHGTKLARTLFTIATGVERAEPWHSTNTDGGTDDLGWEDISGNREFQQWNH